MHSALPAVRMRFADSAGAYIDDVTTDALGNLICRKKGAKGGKKLLFAAHMDSIGVVATYIEDKGFIRFSQIGGLYVGDLLNIQVKFANGTRGVISYEEKTPLKDLTLDNLFIDIGAKNAEEARKLVQIGDFAVYEAPRFEQNGVRPVSGQPYRLCDAPADDGAAGGQGNRERPVLRVYGTGGGWPARRRRGSVRS